VASARRALRLSSVRPTARTYPSPPTLQEAAKAEFESEQRYLDTLAHLPSSEADIYRQRQGVSWMYLKPPG